MGEHVRVWIDEHIRVSPDTLSGETEGIGKLNQLVMIWQPKDNLLIAASVLKAQHQ